MSEVVEMLVDPKTGDEVLGARTTSLSSMIKIVARRRVVIAACVASCAVLGALFIVLSPARFTASASLLIDTRKMPWFQGDTMIDTATTDDGAVESQIETIRSEQVALAVVRHLKLAEDAEFVGAKESLFHTVRSLLGLPDDPESEQTLERAAVESFKTKLKVTRTARSYIAQIELTSLDKDKAARIANATAEGYIDDLIDARFAVTKRASVWLQARIKELREQSTSSYAAIQDFKTEKNIIVGSDGKLISDLELESLANDLAKARGDTAQQQARAERLTSLITAFKAGSYTDLPDPSVVEAMNNPIISKLREQFLDSQQKEAEWSSKYGPQHQASVTLRQQMASLQKSIWDEMERLSEATKSDFQIAKSHETFLSHRLAELFADARSTRTAQVQLRELEVASNTYRSIYENFLNKYTQAVQQQSFPATDARILTYATPPRAKSSPKTALILVLAAFAGLALGFAVALVREQLDRVVHARDQMIDAAGIQTLAVIPVSGLVAAAATPSLAARVGALWLTFLGRGARKSSDLGKAPILLTADAPAISSEVEAFRSVKVAIDLRRRGERGGRSKTGGKVVGIVSCLPGEGKTSVTASLANLVAVESDSPTLAIDGDLRNPSLTYMLGGAGKPGLLDILNGINDKGDDFDFSPLVLKGPGGLDVVVAPTRTTIGNSADILASDQMEKFLTAARTKYSYVFVDLPPLLPAVDVRAAAHCFDYLVFVVEWGKTTVDEVAKAMSSEQIKSRTIGAVLNKVDPVAMRLYEGGETVEVYGPYA